LVQFFQFMLGPTATVTATTAIDFYQPFLLPGKWLIKAVRFIPDIAVTANGTNFCTYTLTNVTASTTIGTRSYAATDSVAGTGEAVTLPAGLAAVITDGDVIKLAITSAASGVASRSRFVVEVERAPLP
jgi:hypothetical protein